MCKQSIPGRFSPPTWLIYNKMYQFYVNTYIITPCKNPHHGNHGNKIETHGLGAHYSVNKNRFSVFTGSHAWAENLGMNWLEQWLTNLVHIYT